VELMRGKLCKVDSLLKKADGGLNAPNLKADATESFNSFTYTTPYIKGFGRITIREGE